MKLSVIIPCYNMQAYLPTCLDSVLKQELNLDEMEVIVVNDESTDATLNIAKRYESEYQNIKVIDKRNEGVGAARNSGLDMARGKYIYFLDPDDYLAENTIRRILQLIEKYDLEILTFDSRHVKNSHLDKSKSDVDKERELKILDGITYIAERKFQNEIWWYLIKREFMINTGIRFLEGRWMEDAILTGQLFCRAKRMAHIDLDVHRYRILPTSAMRNKSPEHYNKVIFDNANAAFVYDELIREIPENHSKAVPCKIRLKTRQQSFVFFLLVRLMKSDISVDEIPNMLIEFEEIDAFPLKKFLGADYQGFAYSFMVFIFNHKPIIKPFVKFFRVFYRLVR